MKKLLLTIALISLSGLASVFAQYPPNYHYTFLDQGVTDEIIALSSGDLAFRHIIELAGYSRSRKASEFVNNFPESDYVISRLKEYGINDYKIERFGKVSTWRGLEGSLWEIEPGLSKIADFNDLPLMLASGSNSTEVEAPIVWIGDGSPSFLESADLKDKVVLTSANLRSVHSRVMKLGALGTVSFYSPRPLVDPVQIPSSRISGEGFGFVLPPREAHLLRDRLSRGEEIKVKVSIKSTTEELEMQVPTCVIKGTDADADEIIITAHIFEGYVKMGANDNLSGSAVILEVANVLNQLINDGIIERPKRNIRFLWVPEFSGTIPWVDSHKDIIDRTIFNLNLDMVGLNLRESQSFFCFHKSGYSTASYANDVVESYYRYVGETNRQGITDRMGRRGFAKRIVSPTGTDDPFYYRIMTLHGSSDHAVFNDANIGVPGLKMITWPDNFYHTSNDRPENCDPTQLRRAIFITAASTYTIASADDDMAIRIASDISGFSSHRMGIQLAKAMDQLSKAGSENIESIYKRSVYNLEGLALGEIASLMKLEELIEEKGSMDFLSNQKVNLEQISATHLLSLRQYMEKRCANLGINPVSIKLSALEKRLAQITPAHTSLIREHGYRTVQRDISALSPEIREGKTFRNIVNTNELAGLAGGAYSVLDIKKMLDSQFEMESPLDEIMNYLELMKEAGLITF